MASPKTLSRAALVALAVFALSGCLTLESTVRMNEDGSGRLILVYSLAEELYDYGVFDQESSRRTIPVSERDFEVAALAAEGVRLSRYRTERSDGIVTVEVHLDFETPEGLAGLLNVGEEELIVSGTETLLRQPLFYGFEGAVDSELIEEFWSEVRFIHRVRAPRDIRAVSMGEITDGGREAVVDLKLIDLVQVGEPVVWEVAW